MFGSLSHESLSICSQRNHTKAWVQAAMLLQRDLETLSSQVSSWAAASPCQPATNAGSLHSRRSPTEWRPLSLRFCAVGDSQGSFFGACLAKAPPLTLDALRCGSFYREGIAAQRSVPVELRELPSFPSLEKAPSRQQSCSMRALRWETDIRGACTSRPALDK